jgi:hypothetical protein
MEGSHTSYLAELGVSHRYVQAHAWIVNAITGWLSAYYMEDPRFRVSRRYEDMETGTQVWVCELEDGVSMIRLIKRLGVDIPPYYLHERRTPVENRIRYVIDLPEAGRGMAP